MAKLLRLLLDLFATFANVALWWCLYLMEEPLRECSQVSMPDGCLISWQADGCQWSADYLWRAMGWISRADVILLAVMLAYTVAIACGRFCRFSATRRYSRAFVHDAPAAMQHSTLTEVSAIAAENSRSHVASVVAAGLVAFASASPHLTDAEAIGAANRAFHRSRKRVAADLRRGAGTLTSIASCAPFIGLLGTVFGIMNAFNIPGDRSSALAIVARYLAEALLTTAIGLFVAIPATWCRNYIFVRTEIFDSEMSNAAFEMVTYLNTHCQWRNQSDLLSARTRHYVSVLDDTSGARSWEIPNDQQRGLLLALCFCTFIFVLGVLMWFW